MRIPFPLRVPTTLALGALLLSGCYRYVPTELSDVRPQQTVRVRVADEAMPAVRNFVEPREATVSGRVVAVRPDSVELRLETPVAFRQVTLPRSWVLDSSVREVDKGKSFLISAALVGAVGYLAYLGFEGRGGGQAIPGPQPDEQRIPLLELALPFLP